MLLEKLMPRFVAKTASASVLGKKNILALAVVFAFASLFAGSVLPVSAESLFLTSRSARTPADSGSAGEVGGQRGSANYPPAFYEGNGNLGIGDRAQIGSVNSTTEIEVTDEAALVESEVVAQQFLANKLAAEKHRIDAASNLKITDKDSRKAAEGLLGSLQQEYSETKDSQLLGQIERLLFLLSDDSGAVIVQSASGKVAGVLVLIVLFALGVYLYRRRKSKNKEKDQVTTATADQTATADTAIADQVPGAGGQRQQRQGQGRRRRRRNRRKQEKPASTTAQKQKVVPGAA